MGGDLGPRSTLPAAINFAARYPHVHLSLIGLPAALPSVSPKPNITLIHADDVVTMEDRPAVALRNRQGSSMWKAVSMVANNQADACVSAGNTGALMAMGKFLLKTFPGIDRPAICKVIPGDPSDCVMLDLGANIECTAEQLLQFALMGSVLAAGDDALEQPRVALLNVGAEASKGREQVRLAASLLQDSEYLRYVGFVEGDGIFRSEADVVVCDGFTGNVALKASEGAATLLAEQLKALFNATPWWRLVGYFARPLLLKWHTRFDPARYNGASFLGLQGTVIKSHGSADSAGFECALSVALEQAERQLPQRINQRIAQYLI